MVNNTQLKEIAVAVYFLLPVKNIELNCDADCYEDFRFFGAECVFRLVLKYKNSNTPFCA